MSKLVCGVGINDADYVVCRKMGGKRLTCQYYAVWHSMMRRCYGEKYRETRPAYSMCFVCEEWLTFSNFKAWMEKQAWEGNQLDKDLLMQGNKEYNPEKCLFISGILNKLLTARSLLRGEHPIGVSWSKEHSVFSSGVSIKGRRKHLGYFTTSGAAHKSWQVAKKLIIHDVATEQADERLKAALLLRCDQLQYDIDNGLETIKL